MMHSIAGIDYSIGGPALCIHPDVKDWDSNTCRFIYMTGTKIRQGHFMHNCMSFKGFGFLKDYKYDVERYIFSAGLFVSYMLEYNVVDVNLEGYAYGAKGRGVFNIAESTGILKYTMMQKNLNINVDQPGSVKKFATGKGNANKAKMVEAFEKDTGLDLLDLFKLPRVSGPADDLADAYFLCKLFHHNRYYK